MAKKKSTGEKIVDAIARALGLKKKRRTASSSSSEPVKRSRTSQTASQKTADVRNQPRSVRKKAGYWKVFYYTFGILFILAGAIYILVFVSRYDPKMFGLTNEYNSEAKELISRGEYDKAEELLEKTLAIDESNADAIMMLADIYRGQERYSSELAVLLDGISYASNSANTAFYRRIIQSYVSQNRIEEACRFCAGLSSYMATQLSDRPENIQTTQDQGVYSYAITVRLSVPDNCKVYYTTDGSFPDVRNSRVYDSDGAGIIVNRGSVTLRAVAVNEETSLVSNLFEAAYHIYNENAAYEFVDKRVEEIVRVMLNRGASEKIYIKDLSKITEFSTDISGLNAGRKIMTLEDLVVMSDLRKIVLTGETDIEDYTILNSSASLQSLALVGVSLESEAMTQLCSLTNITSLQLSNDTLYRVTEIVALRQLTSLNLSDNFITDISPLASLDKLTELNLSNNRIKDLSVLSGLTSLRTLDISNNVSVETLNPLKKLSALRSLTASGLPVSNIDPLGSLKNLETLYLDNTGVTSLSALSGCKSLVTLNVTSTNATGFEHLASTSLAHLTAQKCSLTGLGGFGGLTKLEILDVSQNNISSVSPLAGCTSLRSLYINDNASASGFGDLTSCPSLLYMECNGCPIAHHDISALSEKGVNVVSD